MDFINTKSAVCRGNTSAVVFSWRAAVNQQHPPPPSRPFHPHLGFCRQESFPVNLLWQLENTETTLAVQQEKYSETKCVIIINKTTLKVSRVTEQIMKTSPIQSVMSGTHQCIISDFTFYMFQAKFILHAVFFFLLKFVLLINYILWGTVCMKSWSVKYV